MSSDNPQSTNVNRYSTGSPFEDAIGYARAVECDGWIFVAGTTGYDYASMTMPEAIEDQTRNALATIERSLRHFGANLEHVVRVRYYVVARDLWPRCWPILSNTFGLARPAATMTVSTLQEEEMLIEIEATARRPR